MCNKTYVTFCEIIYNTLLCGREQIGADCIDNVGVKIDPCC